jgi:hypothetical protein
MSVSVKTYDFTMPAGGAFQIQAVGSYFRIQTTTGPVRVQGEFGDLSPLYAGQGIKDSPFTRLNLTNLSAVAITGSVIVADAEFVDQQMVLSGSVNSNITGGSLNANITGGIVSTTPNWYGVYNTVKTFKASRAQPSGLITVAGYADVFNPLVLMPVANNGYLRKLTIGSNNGVAARFYMARWNNTYGSLGSIFTKAYSIKDLTVPMTGGFLSVSGSISRAVADSMEFIYIGTLTNGDDKEFDFSDRPISVPAAGLLIYQYVPSGSSQASFTATAVWDEV